MFLTYVSRTYLMTYGDAGFDLTSKKWFVNFSNENNCKTDFIFFHSRSSKMALSGIFLPFCPTEKHQICIL